MRFEKISIENYGIFPRRTIDLSNANGLVVVYGANEAGKSTTLSAVSDLLYGVPVQSPHAEVFGGPKLAISAVMHLKDGTRRELRRKKGNSKTLMDGTGAALDQDALGAVLGSTGRDRFESLFGLNHESLRKGGKSLLLTNGEIGRMILEAGGGLRNLASRMQALKKQSEDLFTQRKAAGRRFYDEKDRFDEANKRIKAAELTQRAYEKTEEELKALSRERAGLREQIRATQEQISRLQRLERALPPARRLQRLREELSQFEGLPDPETAFDKLVTNALSNKRDAQKLRDDASRKIEQLYGDIEDCSSDPALIALKLEINKAAQLAVSVKSARGDRERRVAELNRSLAELETLRRITGRPNAEEVELKSIAPPEHIRGAVVDTAAAIKELEHGIKAASKVLVELTASVTALEVQLKQRAELGFDRPSGVDVGALNFLELVNDAAAKRAQAQTRRERAAAKCARHAAPAPECFAWRIPTLDHIQEEAARRADIHNEARNHQNRLEKAESDKREAQAAIDALKLQGELPSEQEVLGARGLRDEAWQPIRAIFTLQHDTAEGLMDASAREAVASALETHTAEADRLADLRTREAQRAANLNNAEARLIAAETEILEAQNRRTQTSERLASAIAAWAANWHVAAEWQPDLLALRNGIQDLELARADWQAAEDLEQEAISLDARIQSGIIQLQAAELALNISPDPAAQLQRRVQDVRSKCEHHGTQYQAWISDQNRVFSAREKVLANQKELEESHSNMAALQQRWKELVTAIGLPEGTLPAAGAEAAGEWKAASGHFSSIENTRRRLTRMAEDEGDLADVIRSIFEALKQPIPQDAVAAANQLSAALRDAEVDAGKKQTLERELVGYQRAFAQATRELQTAETAVNALCLERSCDEAKLASDAVLFTRYTEHLRQIVAAEENLRTAGDQQPIEHLMAALEGKDQDALVASLAEQRSIAEALGLDLERVTRAEQTRRDEHKRVLGGNDVLAAVTERESAASALRQTVSDYLELALARELLSAAMERLRQERQNPLVMLASRLFERATMGAYAGLRAEANEKGEVSVVGLRRVAVAPTGDLLNVLPSTEEEFALEEVAVDRMSDGTRDQLYLAFRVAAVEQYCSSTEPLPFVADDLLVHFDDERSRAALEMLAELGTSTQVLLFTHHIQVRDAARELENLGSATVVELV